MGWRGVGGEMGRPCARVATHLDAHGRGVMVVVVAVVVMAVVMVVVVAVEEPRADEARSLRCGGAMWREMGRER